MGGFNGVIGVLRSVEMGLLTSPLWLSGAGGIYNVYRLSRLLNPFLLLTGVYCGYMIITIVSADFLGADAPPPSWLVNALSAGICCIAVILIGIFCVVPLPHPARQSGWCG